MHKNWILALLKRLCGKIWRATQSCVSNVVKITIYPSVKLFFMGNMARSRPCSLSLEKSLTTRVQNLIHIILLVGNQQSSSTTETLRWNNNTAVG